MQIYIANDNVLVLDGLKDIVSDAYVNSATVTAQLKTTTGTDVGGPLALGYVPGSSGRYRATLEEDLPLEDQTAYEVHIDADAGSDLKAHWEVTAIAVTRRA